ncbi:MAG TPA: hypothetical protein VFQ45_09840 [Longimicrobium sp.]|nr:hypothetical protein [Longimicrobium sp.]
MTRRLEAMLWALALALALGGWLRWRAAEPDAAPLSEALAAAPAPPARVPRARLEEAARLVAAGNPFRLERAPAPIGFGAPAVPGMPGMPDGPPVFAPPPPPRPELRITGIVGPPWQAMLEGVPGRQEAVVVRRGDVLGDLRVRSVTRESAVIAGPDTTWTLTVRRPWQ